LNLRGMFRTGKDGQYWFRAVKPKYYPIPDDGPIGKLLNALGRHPLSICITSSRRMVSRR
jgi:catechol 1,2-dioxygenase